jgi:hypothetical protein
MVLAHIKLSYVVRIFSNLFLRFYLLSSKPILLHLPSPSRFLREKLMEYINKIVATNNEMDKMHRVRNGMPLNMKEKSQGKE